MQNARAARKKNLALDRGVIRANSFSPQLDIDNSEHEILSVYLLRAIALAFLIEPAIAADQVIALKAARLFDGKSRALIQDGWS